ncbi:MAG: hypothetical protein ABI035_02510 [Gemmatimonadaceae bacterium]
MTHRTGEPIAELTEETMVQAIAALLTVALTGTGNAAPRCVDSPPPSDYVYTFRATGDSDKDPTSGTVRAHGDRMRIDMDKNHSGEYILLTDGGQKMTSVHPDKKEVDQMSVPKFEHIIGTSLKAVSPMVKFNVLNDRIGSERIGAGAKMLGYATDQIRITEQFDVHIVALGFNAGTEHHTVVTDYWVSPGLYLGDNPLLALLEHAGTAMAQTDADFVQSEASARASALRGTPLRTVVKETTVDDKGKSNTTTRTIEITSLNIGAQSAALFEIPSGYRIRRNSFTT